MGDSKQSASKPSASAPGAGQGSPTKAGPRKRYIPADVRFGFVLALGLIGALGYINRHLLVTKTSVAFADAHEKDALTDKGSTDRAAKPPVAATQTVVPGQNPKVNTPASPAKATPPSATPPAKLKPTIAPDYSNNRALVAIAPKGFQALASTKTPTAPQPTTSTGSIKADATPAVGSRTPDPQPINPYFRRFLDRQQYFVRDQDTWTNIAYRLYGTEQMASALQNANPEVDCKVEPPVGYRLRLPKIPAK